MLYHKDQNPVMALHDNGHNNTHSANSGFKNYHQPIYQHLVRLCSHLRVDPPTQWEVRVSGMGKQEMRIKCK
jgi:hypothetical protein